MQEVKESVIAAYSKKRPNRKPGVVFFALSTTAARLFLPEKLELPWTNLLYIRARIVPRLMQASRFRRRGSAALRIPWRARLGW